MKYYSVTNGYLNSIQQGVQAVHTLGEMVNKYYSAGRTFMLYDWMRNHKTVVFLNGGNNAKLLSFYDFLADEKNPYPYVQFHEDSDSLGCMLTSVAVIVPESIYGANLDEPNGDLTSWEFELATLLRRMPSAR